MSKDNTPKDKNKKKHKHPEAKKIELPKEVLALLEKEKLNTGSFISVAIGDMDNNGCFTNQWLAFDEKGLYIATGKETLRKKFPKKKTFTEYSLTQLETIPIGEYEKLKMEQYVSTCRLIGEKDGEDYSLTKFTIGLISSFEIFCKMYNGIKEGKSLEELNKGNDAKDICPKCKVPLPEGISKCPNCSKKKSTVKRMFSFFGGYIPQISVVLVSMVIGTAISLLAPKIGTQKLFGDILPPEISGTYDEKIKMLVFLILAIVGIRLLNTAFNTVYGYIIGGIMPRLIYDIKLKIFTAMQKLSVGFYSSKQTGTLMERVFRDSQDIYWFFVDGLPYLIISCATVVGILALMFTISIRLTLLVIIFLPLLIFTLFIGDKIFRKLFRRFRIMNARVVSLTSDNINGQRIIKAFSKEGDEYEKYSETSGKLMAAELKLRLTESTVFPLLSLVLVILTSILIATGSFQVIDGKIRTADLLLFITYINMLMNPIHYLSWVSNWWARCFTAAQRVFEIIDSKPDVLESENPIVNEDFKGEIDISELVFEYEPARPVIKKLNLHVGSGEMLGIVGKTGAGKTTIANLIARLYDAKEGAIKIDGIDVKDMSMQNLRANVGLVSQEIYLFIGSIADNIRYAKPDADFSEVIRAAKAASAHDFIMKLPDGYDTRVGSGGQDLSGGERQRISIARTIIQNPKILILDEATAAMDTATERNIQESLSSLKEGRTTIAIAHRLSTLRDADRLAVIVEGNIVEHGTFVELIKKKEEFYKLYKIQNEALKSVGIVE